MLSQQEYKEQKRFAGIGYGPYAGSPKVNNDPAALGRESADNKKEAW
jgi:hypothetical protein